MLVGWGIGWKKGEGEGGGGKGMYGADYEFDECVVGGEGEG